VTARTPALQTFVDAALVAFGSHAVDEQSRRAMGEISIALRTPGNMRTGAGSRIPACDCLEDALSREMRDDHLAGLVAGFRAVEPALAWRTREDTTGTASADFADGHANAMVVGPGGLEDRRDIWLGCSLLAPHVRYPDHDHAPEEIYLVLSPGEFRQDDGAWFVPGVGGSFYNRPNIKHAMRALDAPLFAFWLLQL
jgi:hypothetical protein